MIVSLKTKRLIEQACSRVWDNAVRGIKSRSIVSLSLERDIIPNPLSYLGDTLGKKDIKYRLLVSYLSDMIDPLTHHSFWMKLTRMSPSLMSSYVMQEFPDFPLDVQDPASATRGLYQFMAVLKHIPGMTVTALGNNFASLRVVNKDLHTIFGLANNRVFAKGLCRRRTVFEHYSTVMPMPGKTQKLFKVPYLALQSTLTGRAAALALHLTMLTPEHTEEIAFCIAMAVKCGHLNHAFPHVTWVPSKEVHKLHYELMGSRVLSFINEDSDTPVRQQLYNALVPHAMDKDLFMASFGADIVSRSSPLTRRFIANNMDKVLYDIK